ncbi:hypothetical protein [Halogeometricum luteum]|uniref:Uncharacterized protein n=1 Tax=Halogeometricum luteum TaxID=2950537 RepID=A0ABU2G4K4_9EURY|nr:hypothetical protein [Halogeometricum sp. S3BR5-2]MDS0295715.1 hypothetical protein [Halogeometricum sp. S3BR5-2]
MSEENNKTSTSTDDTASTSDTDSPIGSSSLQELWETLASLPALEHPVIEPGFVHAGVENVVRNQRSVEEIVQEYVRSSGVERMSDAFSPPEYRQGIVQSTAEQAAKRIHKAGVSAALQQFHEPEAIVSALQPAIQNQKLLAEVVEEIARPAGASLSPSLFGVPSTSTSSTAYAQTESVSFTSGVAVGESRTSTSNSSASQAVSPSHRVDDYSFALRQLQIFSLHCRYRATEVIDNPDEIAVVTLVAIVFLLQFVEIETLTEFGALAGLSGLAVRLALFTLKKDRPGIK